MTFLEAAQDMFSSIMDKSDFSETSENLLTLKKELAEEYIKKMEKEKSDLFLSIGRDSVVDYLMDEGFTDGIHDAVVEQALNSLSWLSWDLKNFREKLNNAATEQEIADLKNQILTPSIEFESQFQESESTPQDPDLTSEKESSTLEAANSEETEKSDTRAISSSEKKENLWNIEGFDATKIQSSPFRRNPKTGVTLCAATAKFNAQQFWLTFPSGNAWDASTTKPTEKEYQSSLPASKIEERPKRNWSPLSISDFDAMKGVNVADIFPDSKSGYGHRAVAFRDKNGERMVLDPYIKVAWIASTEPKKLEEYMKSTKVFKSHFYAVG